MKPLNKLVLCATALALVAALGGCNRGGSPNRPAPAGAAGKSNGGGSAGGPGAGSSLACPPQADVAAAVGAPVEQKPRGAATCYYETPDFETSVTIMSVSPGSADQLLAEMKESAKPYGAEVTAIDVGERAFAWGAARVRGGLRCRWRAGVHARPVNDRGRRRRQEGCRHQAP